MFPSDWLKGVRSFLYQYIHARPIENNGGSINERCVVKSIVLFRWKYPQISPVKRSFLAVHIQ